MERTNIRMREGGWSYEYALCLDEEKRDGSRQLERCMMIVTALQRKKNRTSPLRELRSYPAIYSIGLI